MKRALLFLLFFPTLFSWVTTYDTGGFISYEVMSVGNPIITIISIYKDSLENNFSPRYFLQIYSLIFCFISYKYLTFYNLNELKKHILELYNRPKKIFKIAIVLILVRLVYDFAISHQPYKYDHEYLNNNIENDIEHNKNLIIYCTLYFVIYVLCLLTLLKDRFSNNVKYLIVMLLLFPISTLSLEKILVSTEPIHFGFYELLKPLVIVFPDMVYSINP